MLEEVNVEDLSPMMKLYMATKKDYMDCLLFYRLGDFYELFFDDAITASRLLDITLTGRSCGLKERAPMCGVPYHAVDSYVAKILEHGYKVAICDQMSEPKQGEIVNREVTRVITPGTIIESEILEGKTSNYLLCLYKEGNSVGASYCDVSTGEFKVNEFKDNILAQTLDLLTRIRPSEILANEEMVLFATSSKAIKALEFIPNFTKMADFSFDEKNCEGLIKKQFGISSIKGHDFALLRFAMRAGGGLLDYLQATQKRNLNHINKIVTEHNSDFMRLDYNACKNLELIENAKDKKRRNSLLGHLNKTKTAMGLRLLEKWILQPLQKSKDINIRLDCLEELFYNNMLLNDITQMLASIGDIERTCAKISYGTILPKDCIGLKNSLNNVVNLASLVGELKQEKFQSLFKQIDSINNLVELLEKAFIDNGVNVTLGEGFIRPEFNSELFELKNMSKNAQKWLDDLKIREQEKTGIKNLRIGYSKVFGYFIEVLKSQEELVPYRYVRKQTISNHERFVTDELKEIEEKLLSSKELAIKLENEIYSKIKDHLRSIVGVIQEIAQEVAFVDVISSFATISQEYNYVRPVVSERTKFIKIVGGRHPIVEANLKHEMFVNNDAYLDDKDDRTIIITGPNMAGKSTYMRQIAIIVIMAHIGCFVPATSAQMGIIDRVFTRIGASDDLSSGQSTFMVEMVEVANIINNATAKSLVLLDEVGRGTATYDGMSIAWAILEYISQKIKCKTLFSTHYHEITTLEGKLEGVKNFQIGVKEFNNSIIFLRKVVRGSADKSFGIEVASLSGIYDEIVVRAKEILRTLESNSIKLDLNKIEENKGLTLQEKNNIINKIKNIDMNTLSPMEAFEMLANLNKSCK